MLVKYSNTDSTILLMFLFFNYLWKDYGINHLLLLSSLAYSWKSSVVGGLLKRLPYKLQQINSNNM